MVSTEIENEIKMAAVVGAGLHLGNTESYEILRIRSVDGHNAMYIVKYSSGETIERGGAVGLSLIDLTDHCLTRP